MPLISEIIIIIIIIIIITNPCRIFHERRTRMGGEAPRQRSVVAGSSASWHCVGRCLLLPATTGVWRALIHFND
jgi:hypothetical protein